jgi:5'-deoxynucleotidase YfbR-like HD superfamily hydrolase
MPEQLKASLEAINGRNDALRSVTRYSLYDVMLYRTNLYTHAHRVAALIRAINPAAMKVFGPTYDPIKTELLGFVHDDAEIEFGDVQAGNKSKMTTVQLREVEDAEKRAIDVVAGRFPSHIAGYKYKDLLLDAAEHTSLESQVVSYADKYDAYGEALHEIYAGNHYFVTNVVNEYGRIPSPTEYYVAYFQAFGNKFPAMAPLLAEPLPCFEPCVGRDYASVVKKGRPHTKESLYIPTGEHHYDTWRQIIVADTNDEVVRDLYVQKEFLA